MAVAASLVVATGAAAATPEAIQASVPPRLELFAVSINGTDQGEQIWVLRDSSEALYLPLPSLTAWRVKPGGARTLPFQDTTYVAVGDIAGVTFVVDVSLQSLDLTVVPASFDDTRIAVANDHTGAMTRSNLGGFVNYELLGHAADGRVGMNGAFELGIFSRSGTGSTTFIGRLDEDGQKLTRLETNWTIDDPARLRSMRFGDSITRGGIGAAPLRFAGFQIASNFATQPGFITMALPTVNGTAAVPSVVDIYVNNILQTHRQVAPGPFQLTDVPVITGNGDIRLIVRDTLGRETSISQSYYVSPQLLAAGLHDYSYEVGFLRRDFALESNRYGPAVASATHRYGLTDKVTIEAHAEATRRTQAGSLAVNLLWPEVGIFSASAAASRSAEGNGALLGLGFERRTRGFSLGAAGEITTDNYATVGSSPDYPRARSSARLFTGLPTRFGSLGASLLWRGGRSEPDAAFLGASASVRLRGLGTLQISGRQSLTGSRDTALQVFMTIPIGQRTSASVGLQQQGGGFSATADVQQNLPAGPGIGYRGSAAIGEVDRLSGALQVQTGIGNLEGELTWVEGKTGARLTLSGSVATLDGQVFASRTLNQSFAAVRVGDYPGVRVYADNQLVGRTNRSGVVMIPRLRPFEDNRIRIEIEDLPLDTMITGGEQTVRPFDRSGVVVRFAATETRGGLLKVLMENGEDLPTATTVLLNGKAEEFVSAPGGDVYLTDLQPRNVVVAMLGARRCTFGFAFTAGLGAQPQLGKFTCVMVAQ